MNARLLLTGLTVLLLAAAAPAAGDPPDAVILKECAAFFPGSSERMKEYIVEWVVWCREANVIPIISI